MADDALPLDVGPDHEAGDVGEEEERKVEGVADPDEARRLVGAVNEQNAALLHRLIGDDPDDLPAKAGETGQQLLREELFDLEPRGLIYERFDDLSHVISALGLLGDQFGDRPACRRVARFDPRRTRRPVCRQVGEVSPSGRDGGLVVSHQEVAAAADRAVHPGSAKLLERDLLADNDLHHPRRAEVHRGIALDHDHDVAEGRDVGPTRRRGAEEEADLGHLAGEADLVVKDPAGVAAAREHIDLVGDPGAGAVHQVEERDLEPGRRLLDPDDLLNRARAPGARLDGRVVRHHRDRPALDGAQSGDHAVGRQLVGEDVGEESILDEGAGVEEEVEPLANGELVLLAQLGQVAGAARQGHLAQLPGTLAHSLSGP